MGANSEPKAPRNALTLRPAAEAASARKAESPEPLDKNLAEASPSIDAPLFTTTVSPDGAPRKKRRRRTSKFPKQDDSEGEDREVPPRSETPERPRSQTPEDESSHL